METLNHQESEPLTGPVSKGQDFIDGKNEETRLQLGNQLARLWEEGDIGFLTIALKEISGRKVGEV